MKLINPYRPCFPILVLLFFTCGLFLNLQAQVSPQMYEYPHNHLPWYTIESDNFLVHYQEGSSRSAQLASKYAEEIYEPITALYGHEPRKKVSIVIRDREDFSNGAAFFFDDKIEIWVPALDTPLRGTHYWLQNVVTHEFTHIVQLGASMKRSQRFPAIYLQWLSYEDVRRPDVLYGFPNGLITMPFATVSMPAWFVEGTAQYQRNGYNFDYWDSHRDMILRTRILSDTYLDLVEMGTFTSKTSIERETVYNQGFSFTIYLVGRFGEQVIADISKKAAESGKNDINEIMMLVTGYSGKELFSDFINNRKEYYSEQSEHIIQTETTSVEPDGFFNFYPQYSSNGNWFGYLTNRGRDAARTALVLRKDDSEISIENLGGTEQIDYDQEYRVSHHLNSNLALDFISNRFSFSPDGDKIAYSKAEKNRYGETYQDIYIHTLDENESFQLTHSARIQDPVWHPAGNSLVGVQQTKGTQNLVEIDAASGEKSMLTSYQSGETVFTPVFTPDGRNIYYAAAYKGNRNIYRLDLESGDIYPVFQDEYIDFRDPWISPDQEFLYYSSDATGIFNIYRKKIGRHSAQQITDVIGGAFMPFAKGDSLYLAEYKHDGYKITRQHIKEFEREATIEPYIPEQELIALPAGKQPAEEQTLESFDDLYGTGETVEFEIYSESASSARTWQPYNETTTGLSLFPVIRFDNYSKLRGSNSNLLWNGRFGALSENIWRDIKAGAYFSSRDVTENLSIFGGALIGLGSIPADGVDSFFSPSRFNKLDRDIFFIAEHRGIPFIKRNWSPTISLEVYNLKRNVRNGLSIEEFACTACLPEERLIDIRYNIWEANLFLRSKLNRWSLIEFGASYSPYSVTTEGFFSEEFREFIPGSTSQYYKASTFSASYIADLTIPERHSDIAPRGLKGSFTYKYQPARLLDSFEINDGTLSPVFEREYNHSLEINSRIGFRISENSNVLFSTRGFTYLNSPDDFFYLDYVGGLIGMRSYPFFSVGGQTTAFTRASLLRQIFQHINRHFGAYTFDKIYANLFIEAGNGWGGPLDIGNNLKTGIGAELRFAFNSYYLFPMKLFVNTTYGFNRFDVNLPTEFISTTGGRETQYGQELLFYFGLTFDFDLL